MEESNGGEMLKKVFVHNYLTFNKHKNGFLVALFILALCFVLSSIYWNELFSFSHLLVARPSLVFVENEYWRLLTTIFVHGDLKHLLSNSIMLVVMSYFVHSHFGTKVYPFISLIMGAIVNIIVLKTFEHEVALVGISGVVYFLWGFWLTLFLKIERQVPLSRRIMKVLIVGSFLLIPEAFEANVSHLSHFLGFVLGVLNGFMYYFIFKKEILSYERWDYQLEEENDDYIESETQNYH